MNRTLLFLIFSLGAWAWLLQTWIAAAGMLLIILINKSISWRWNITLQQFYRWGDLASLLTLLLLMYVYLTQADERPIFIVLKWLPLLFCPVLFAQLFSSEQKLPLGTLFYSYRRRQFSQKKHRLDLPGFKDLEGFNLAPEIDFQLPYAALTLLSAGAANVQNLSYFTVAVFLFVGVLWNTRPKHASKSAWFILIILAIISSHFGQLGLRKLQNIVEYNSMEWFDNWHSDPFKTQTSIGDLGEMKLSDKIAFRVKAQHPVYLLQASYDYYLGKNWAASRAMFSDENPVKAAKKQSLQRIEILQQFHNREEMLALPDGTTNITGLEGANLQYNLLGAVKITDTPDFGDYQVFFSGERGGTPSRYDLQIPKQHSDWLSQLSHTLALSKLQPTAAATQIENYFQHNFYYSLYLGSEPDADLALRNFILKSKAGHCEYFAVASVLLLRQAGIPARLANGYVAEEFDPQQNLYLVRRRHAHAWAIAYINKHWQIVDATPSQWLEMENKHASLFQPLNDWFSNRLFAFKQWQMQHDKNQNAVWLSAAFVLACYIGWRIYSAKQQLTRTTKNEAISRETTAYQGLDSEFYLIEQHFEQTEFARNQKESIAQWIKRLQIAELDSLATLHYQLRFDPCSLLPEKREELHKKVNNWLKHNSLT
jgi:hypothetical protein